MFVEEIKKRRTFAIISHPDAGKTTLTEKLLLYGGAIHLAGSIKARKAQRHAVSDWMEIEKQRGISVTSSVLQFDYADCRINILDTPGHQDFSEDTYRTLMAVDSAVMVIDAAKGVEAQTKKLFKVCRQRRIPIFTFVNKLDRYGKIPLDLIDEIENVLGIRAYPMNWPVGIDGQYLGTFRRRQFAWANRTRKRDFCRRRSQNARAHRAGYFRQSAGRSDVARRSRRVFRSNQNRCRGFDAGLFRFRHDQLRRPQLFGRISPTRSAARRSFELRRHHRAGR